MRASFLPDPIRHALGHPGVRRACFLGVALCVLDLLGMAFLWAPISVRHGKLQEEVERIHRDRRQAVEAGALAKDFDEMKSKAAELEKKWRATGGQSALVRDMTRLASRRGLRITSQDFAPLSNEGKAQGLRQDLSLTGSYLSLRGFLADLEDLPALLVVDKGRIESGEGGLRASLSLCAYQAPDRGTK